MNIIFESIVQNIWTIAGIIIPSILAYYWYRKAKKIRRLSLFEFPVSEIVTINHPIDGLKISYNNMEIEQLYNTEILLSNTGNTDLAFSQDEEIVISIGVAIIKLESFSQAEMRSEIYSVTDYGGRGEPAHVCIKVPLIKKKENISLRILSIEKPNIETIRTRLPNIQIVSKKYSSLQDTLNATSNLLIKAAEIVSKYMLK